MSIKRLLFPGLLFLTLTIKAQTNFQPGYVVKAIGDTITGEIDSRGDLLMSGLCKFRLNNKEKATGFSPNDIVAFRFKDGKYFISKEIEGKKVFLEYLIKGKVSIYYMRDNLGDHYFISKEDIGFSELKYVEQTVYIDGKYYESKSKNHLAMLNYYMKDVPEIQPMIDELGEPEHQSLIKLAEQYHHLVCKDESCIIYEKKAPFIKYTLEIVGGIINYTKSHSFTEVDDFVGGNGIQGGVLAHFWIPRTSENLYYRTGIIYSGPETKGGIKTVYKIPIQIEYVYPKGIIKPKLAVGINVYEHLYQTFSLMGGVNIQASKKINIGISYDIDFDRNWGFPLLPGNLFTQSILTGLYFHL